MGSINSVKRGNFAQSESLLTLEDLIHERSIFSDAFQFLTKNLRSKQKAMMNAKINEFMVRKSRSNEPNSTVMSAKVERLDFIDSFLTILRCLSRRTEVSTVNQMCDSVFSFLERNNISAFDIITFWKSMINFIELIMGDSFGLAQRYNCDCISLFVICLIADSRSTVIRKNAAEISENRPSLAAQLRRPRLETPTFSFDTDSCEYELSRLLNVSFLQSTENCIANHLSYQYLRKYLSTNGCDSVVQFWSDIHFILDGADNSPQLCQTIYDKICQSYLSNDSSLSLINCAMISPNKARMLSNYGMKSGLPIEALVSIIAHSINRDLIQNVDTAILPQFNIEICPNSMALQRRHHKLRPTHC